ncbi:MULTISPECIES: RHS repeat-associated core domain-containing protein [unclassified Pseudomonas]|uniref:RHS repeat-associated core domain-containing protein n=1 Tax=unclassified Pseudomonas TaxID=196821 RepID=UPI001CBB8789|nr:MULTISPECIES: RHS repeat-associated core domain-containing protein [unclassified Pseudomonas]
MTHANTPAIAVIDSRGLGVRAVAYYRRDNSAVESCITQQVHDVAGRAVLSRDPRLFRLHQAGQSAANQINAFSLSGALLLSENTDAGWRLGLLGEDGQGVEGWDQKLAHSRLHYDGQRRPIASFENAHGEAQRCIARFAYAAARADESLNLCGQLIRQDDTAGTLHYLSFGIGGTPLQHSRTFVEDPQWSVDWPATESERDGFLEDDPAITRLHCNAVGDPIRQTDAKGNTQAFIQTRAAELKEVRLTLAGQTEEKTLVSDIQYNAFGQIERQRAGNGVISCATFRPEDGRLEHLKAYVPDQPAIQDLTYEYDATGNITGLTDTADPIRFHRNQRIEHTHRYRYDSLYRLIAATGRQLRNACGGPQLPAFQSAPDPGQLENYTRIYTYDAAGNLEVMQHQADSASRTERTAIAASSNRSLPQKTNGELPDDNDIAAGYDLNGNRMTLQPGQDLLWDLRNQLRQVDRVVREDEPDDTEIYLYDGSGQRLRKIRQAYTGTLTRIHETRYLPGVEIRSCTDEILHVITVEAGRGKVQVLHWEKKPASGIPQDPHRYSFTDHLKSSTVELDEAARLITWESYYPYGGTCWWAGRSKLEASYKTIRYSGQERDVTGLYYYGFRYYLPWCQRWLSADPAGTADGLNLYAMVHANPVGHVDIAGLIDDHTLQTSNLRDASSSAFVRDFVSRGMSGVVQMSTIAALNTLPASRATNAALETTAGLLDGIAVGIVGGGLAARYHRNAMVFGAIGGALIGVLPAALSHDSDSTDESEVELNQTAINRIGADAGAFIRELLQQILRGHGANFSWGNVSLGDRAPTVHRTVSAYAVTNALNGAFGRFVPESIRSWLGPLIEGADGFVGTWLRGNHPDTNYAAGTSPIQSPPLLDTALGTIGRVTSSLFIFGVNTAVEAATASITGLSASERGDSLNMLSGAIAGAFIGLADYRAVVMPAALDGYSVFDPQAAARISPDVQSTAPRFSSRSVVRRHSVHDI